MALATLERQGFLSDQPVFERRSTLIHIGGQSDEESKRRRARRKTMGPQSERPVRIKRLTLDLPEPLHRAIKVSAAQEGVTMADKLRGLLMKHYGFRP